MIESASSVTLPAVNLPLLGTSMADDASDRVKGGWHNTLETFGSVSILVGGEQSLVQGRWWFGGTLVVAGAVTYVSPATWKRVRGSKARAAKLQYLSYTDSELGPAIVQMVFRSAWGRLFRARQLTQGTKQPDLNSALGVAASKVNIQLLNGDLEVRGRKPNSMAYESIPATDWRSSALHFVPDNANLWRLVLIARGFDDDAAEQRTARLREYNSLIVDARKFELLWPTRDRTADAETRRLLFTARMLGIDSDEVRALHPPSRWRDLWLSFAGNFRARPQLEDSQEVIHRTSA